LGRAPRPETTPDAAPTAKRFSSTGRSRYLSYGPDAANVLFHVVNERHLRGRSTLFTTNKSPLTAWGAVLHGADLAEAILERGRLVLLDGPSYRTQHLDLDVDGAELAHDEPARISGIHTSNYEPG